MDFNELMNYHLDKKADITVVCKDMPAQADVSRYGVIRMNEDFRIVDFEEKPLLARSNTVSTGIYVLRRRQLIEMLEKAAEEDRYDFVTDILVRYRAVKRVYGYKLKTYWSNVAGVDDYFNTNMDFLKPEVRSYFFREEPKIYSRVEDLPPAKYNPGSEVSNSLISSGCIINSKIENSVLFKQVFVGKNCVIKNSVILNDVYIGDNTYVENCIVESDGNLKPNSYYRGEDGIEVISEQGERYKL
jgi:glucose-1-phosphate adenylyltransferase